MSSTKDDAIVFGFESCNFQSPDLGTSALAFNNYINDWVYNKKRNVAKRQPCCTPMLRGISLVK